MKRSDWIISAAFFIFSVAAVSIANALPAREGNVVVFASPFGQPRDALRITGDAGGAIVAATSVDWAIIAKSDDPGFTRKLYESGAWFVGNPKALIGCFSIKGPSWNDGI